MKPQNVINIENTNEISIAKLRANYGNPANGYLEEDADYLRAKILNTPNTEDLYEIKGTKYYFSTEGDDNNDGLSPETPKKTLEAIEALPLKDGDAILFKRGNIFRFARTLTLISGTTYGSYGKGMKPAFYGSPEEYAQNDTWKEVAPNIWEIDFPYDYASGCVIDYSRIIGVQKFRDKEFLAENGDYRNDFNNHKFYLYCDQGKPNEVYSSIEIMNSASVFHITGGHDLTIDNLCIKYSSGFAISMTRFHNNLNITNCEFGFLGGKFFGGKTTNSRYGNAVEFWCGANDVKIENNWFYQTYDSAITWQGNIESVTYKNISFSGNLFEYNNCDIEFFDRTAPLENFVMANNIMRFTSMGWGTRTHDGGVRGIEGCIRAITGSKIYEMALKDVYFKDNKIDCPARQIINWAITPNQREKIHASGTKLYIKSEYRTLKTCLQGLHENLETQQRDRRFAETYEELVEMFPLFEDGAEIYWDGKE